MKPPSYIESMSNVQYTVLKAALLWARNHIEVGVKSELKDAIVERLDAVLAGRSPTTADARLFRESYPGRNPNARKD